MLLRVKRGALVGLVIAIGLSAAACQNKEATNTRTKIEADGPFAKYETPITMHVVRALDGAVKFKSGENIENNVWSRLYEDELGIKLKYDWTVPDTQYNQKLSLAIASNDIPDVMSVPIREYHSLVEAGKVEDMTHYFEEYASPLVKKFAEDDDVTMKLAKIDGRLMSIPSIGSDPSGQANIIYIRKDWLDKVGLQAPKTMDELMEALKLFKEKNAGNNKDGTYGLALSQELTGQGICDLTGFFNAYHAYVDTWIEGKDGKLAYGSIQPEVKSVLAKLSQLYKDGLIDTEFLVKERFKAADDIISGKVGAFYGVPWAAQWCGKNIQANPDAEWIAVPIASIDDKPAMVQLKDKAADKLFYVVKKGFGHPEALVKLINLGTEIYSGSRFSEDTYYTYEYDRKDNTAYMKYIYAKASPYNNSLEFNEKVTAAVDNPSGGEDPRVKVDAGNVRRWKESKNVDGLNSTLIWYGNNSAYGVANTYAKSNRLLFDKFVGAPTNSMYDNNDYLNSRQKEIFSKIIIGELDVNSFDAFVEEWKRLGGDQITKEVNEWYQDFTK